VQFYISKRNKYSFFLPVAWSLWGSFFNAILGSSASSAERWALQADIISGQIRPKHANTLIRICINLILWTGDSCPILNVLTYCIDFRSCLLDANHTILIAQIIARLANQTMILLSCSVNEARSIFGNESPRINSYIALEKGNWLKNSNNFVFLLQL